MEIGKAHSYLGMQIYLEDGCVTMDMCNYVERILQNVEEKEQVKLKEYATPAGKDLFKTTHKGETLPEDVRKFFHTVVAKLLY